MTTYSHKLQVITVCVFTLFLEFAYSQKAYLILHNIEGINYERQKIFCRWKYVFALRPGNGVVSD